MAEVAAHITFQKIQRLTRTNREHDVEYIEDLFKLIQEMFLKDFTYAMEVKAHNLIWKTMRLTIEPVRSSKSKGLENVLNMCIAFLTDLCLLLQAEYGVIFENVPSFLNLSSAIIRKQTTSNINVETRQSFCHFISLRLGDIFRYKEELALAESCYKLAIKSDPSNGSVWNQMILIAQNHAKFADKAYYSARAVDCMKPFVSATTNSASLLRKFAEEDCWNISSPFEISYMHLLATLHFLKPVKSSLFDTVGSNLRDTRHLVPLLSLLKSLGDSEDEERTKAEIHNLLRIAFINIVQSITEKEDSLLLWSVCLLLRLPNICKASQELKLYLLKEPSTQLSDSFYLQHYTCFPDPFTYPVTYKKISDLLPETEDSVLHTKNSLPARPRTIRTVLCAPKD